MECTKVILSKLSMLSQYNIYINMLNSIEFKNIGWPLEDVYCVANII